MTIRALLVVAAVYTAFAPAAAGPRQAPPTANDDDHMAFDVASVRPDPRERGPLEPLGLYLRMLPGGRFEASTTLMSSPSRAMSG